MERTATGEMQFSLIRMTWPVFIELLLQMLVGNIDQIMLSHYNETAVAAVGNANQIMNTLILTFTVISLAATILLSQYLGARQLGKVRQIYTLAAGLNLVLSLVITAGLLLGADGLFALMQVPPEAVPEARSYLLITALSLPCQALMLTFSAFLRAHAHMLVIMCSTGIINLINIVGNTAFIYGLGPLPRMGAAGAALSTSLCRTAGMLMMLFAFFKSVEGAMKVLLKEEASPLCADMVVLAIGVTPDTRLAGAAGLELGVKGSIVVNDRMETSAPDIYAVGDAVQVRNFVTGQDTVVALAGPANKQGRIAADNICGGDSRYTGAQGSSILKVFGMTAALTGLNETQARAAGLDADAVILSPMSHAGYYPGGKVMTMKVVFETGTCRLLGAQIVGYEGVDKRIDVLAAALRAGMKATELKELELAYAPPYSSAKDPVNMAGFLIDNLARGLLKQWRLEEAASLPQDGSVTLLDTRTAEEYAQGHIDGFFNLPVDELREHLDELDPGKPVYVICQSGLRSYIACRILSGHGFTCYNFSGGFRFYDAVTHERVLTEKATACGMDQ